MNKQETTTSTDVSTATGDGSNITRLDDARRTRKAAQESIHESPSLSPTSESASSTSVEQPASDTLAPPPSVKKKSPTTKNRRFNQQKVDQLKARIASGDYEIDAERVANKFIESDRH